MACLNKLSCSALGGFILLEKAPVVEATLIDIETRGDAAVRELSKKFDGYSPASYRLSEAEVEALMKAEAFGGGKRTSR